MKKQVIYLVSLLLLSFYACNSTEDWDDMYDEVVENENVIYGNHNGKNLLDQAYTLVEDDYLASSNESVKDYKNFSSSDPAKEYLPEILNSRFYSSVAGTEVSVTYLYYKGSLGYIKDLNKELSSDYNVYRLNEEDYDSMGEEYGQPGKYDNFSKSAPAEDYLPDFLLGIYPDAEAGELILVEYKYYDGSTSFVNEFYKFDGFTWAALEMPDGIDLYLLSSDDYDSMGTPGGYDNFSSTDKPEYYLPIFLMNKFPYAQVDSKVVTIYKYYEGGGVTETRANEYTKTTSGWVAYSYTEMVTELFKYSGAEWLYVAPIKFVKTDKAATVDYVLTASDYELVGNGKYKNFDVRAGKAEESEDVIIEKITKILKANFNITVGEVYKVSFDIFDGSAGVREILLEAVEDI